ncbi:MAG TPA: dihydroneopterin aldolase [Fimbriimonadaceae bacterium]|jgi:dihydroneopterin aldolase
MFEVFIRDLEFYAYHGVSAEERTVGHRYLVSCWVQVSGSADSTDDVADTVDYGALAGILQAVLLGAPCLTVERLGALCCDAVLDAFALASSVKVSVSKIAPPMPYIAKEAGGVVERKRAGP